MTMTNEEKVRAALDTSTPPEIFSELSRDENDVVRWYVADNPSTPPEILLILMVDDDEHVREEAEATLSKRVMIP